MGRKNFLFSAVTLAAALLCLNTFGQNRASQLPVLHLIIFADNINPAISKSCQADASAIREWADAIHSATGMPVKIYNKEGKFSRHNLDSVNNTVHPGSDDVLIFFYSGHGFRFYYQKTALQFPHLAFEDEKGKTSGGNLEDIHNFLRGKHARLTISIGDLCNTVIDPNATFGHKGIQDNAFYKKLFLQTSGDLLIAAAKPDQSGGAKKDGSGSIFTADFLWAFYHLAQDKPNASWDDLLKCAHDKTVADTKDHDLQEPIYLLHLN